MARNLLCPDCSERMKSLAKKFDELYKAIAGESKKEFICDDCGKIIHIGDLCCASVLLPSKSHFNYKIHKPEAWMDDYIIPDLKLKNKIYGNNL